MKTIEERVENYYDDKLPFHNLDNTLEVLESAMEVVWLCFSEGIEINTQIVYYSVLFSGAGWHEKNKNKKKYAANITKNVLDEYKLSPTIKEKVVKIITNNKVEENEGKAILIAEMDSLTKSYQIFLDKNIMIRKEKELLENKKISWSDYKKIIRKNMEVYLNQDIKLLNGKIFKDLKQKLEKNIKKIMNEDTEKIKNREKILFPEK